MTKSSKDAAIAWRSQAQVLQLGNILVGYGPTEPATGVRLSEGIEGTVSQSKAQAQACG